MPITTGSSNCPGSNASARIFSVNKTTQHCTTGYGEIRSYLQDRGTPIGPLDMMIAAHARSEDMILVTNNVREFERVPDLVVENWAK